MLFPPVGYFAPGNLNIDTSKDEVKNIGQDFRFQVKLTSETKIF